MWHTDNEGDSPTRKRPIQSEELTSSCMSHDTVTFSPLPSTYSSLSTVRLDRWHRKWCTRFESLLAFCCSPRGVRLLPDDRDRWRGACLTLPDTSELTLRRSTRVAAAMSGDTVLWPGTLSLVGYYSEAMTTCGNRHRNITFILVSSPERVN